MRRLKIARGGGVTPVGLRPPFVTPPPPSLILIDAESHLDCRRAAILLVSVELDEILGLSDRIVVMFDGQISGERYAADTDEHDLGMLMAGVNQRESNDATASKVG